MPMELLGYLENWNDVNWWSNDYPGNCLMGCMKPAPYLAALGPYTSVNYGFTFLSEDPDPNQVDCGGTGSQKCPLWDGDGIYIAAKSKEGSTVVDGSTTAADLTPGLVGIGEACRLARMAPDGPRRCKISLGGWSDWARLGSADAARRVASLAAKMVLYSFADGLDLDFEHLTPFTARYGGEFGAFAALVGSLRAELDAVGGAGWAAAVDARAAALNASASRLQPWQRKDYYTTNLRYLKELRQNGPPTRFEISFTTRFNAWVPEDDPYNYLLPSSPVPNATFATDNEGRTLWKSIGGAVDSVNAMVYDAGSAAGPLKINYTQVANNFVDGGVDASKLLLGFEPGSQNGGGAWEGQAADLAWAAHAREAQLGGTFIWALDPDPGSPAAAAAPKLAAALATATGAQWPARFGPRPTFTKCDPTTGWLPSAGEAHHRRPREAAPERARAATAAGPAIASSNMFRPVP